MCYVVVIVIGYWSACAHGQTDALWGSAVSGNWLDTSKWTFDPPTTGVYPNNGSPAATDSYDVTIDATGSPYTISLDADVAVNSFTLNAADATFDHLAGSYFDVGGIAIQTGVYRLRGGTLRDLTITGTSDGQLRGYWYSGVLDNVTLAMDLTLLNSEDVTLANGLTLTPGVMVHMAGSSSDSRLVFEGSQVFDGTGEVIFNAGSQNILETALEGTTLTIGPNVTIRTGTGGGRIGYSGTYDHYIVNQGTISVETSGQTITLHSNWTNQGTIRVSDGTLALGGKFTFADIGTFDRTGGDVVITGIVDNVGQTISLDGTTGSWQHDGTIIGGTITGADSAELIVPAFGTFDGVVLDSSATVRVGGALNIKNDLILDGAHVSLDDAVGNGSRNPFLSFQGTASTLGGTGEIIFNGSGVPTSVASKDVDLTIGPDITIRTGTSGGTIRADRDFALLIQGNIVVETPGQALTVDGNWHNDGTIYLSAGTLHLGGAFETPDIGSIVRTGGDVYLTGILNNTGGIFDTDDWTGPLHLADGANVVGGTLRGGAAEFIGTVYTDNPFPEQPRLDGVTLDADIAVAARISLRIVNGLTLAPGRTISLESHDANYSASILGYGGDQTIDGEGLIAMVGDNSVVSATFGTLTIGPEVTIATSTGSGTVKTGNDGSMLINQGTISAQTDGRTILINPLTSAPSTAFVNHGVVEAINGGIVKLQSNWTNNGLLRIDNGTMVLDGDFTTADMGAISRTGGLFEVRGEVDNTGDTFVLNASTGSIELRGNAEIIKGSLVTDDGTELIAGISSGSMRLVDVHVDADIYVRKFTTLTVTSGDPLAANRHIRLESFDDGGTHGGELYVAAGSVVDGPGEIIFEGQANNSTFRQLSGSLTIAPDVTVRTNGGGGMVGFFNGTLNFQGIASSETDDRTLRLRGTSMTNSGTLAASNGGKLVVEALTGEIGDTSLIGLNSELEFHGTYTNEQNRAVTGGSIWSFYGNWTNDATVTVTNATLNLGGTPTAMGDFIISDSNLNIRDGTLTTAQVNSTGYMTTTVTVGEGGTVNNTGDTITTNLANGPWALNGGTIIGGAVTAHDDTVLEVEGRGNRIDGVLMSTDINVAAGAELVLDGAWRIDGALSADGADILFDGSGWFIGSGIDNFSHVGGSLTLEGTLTLNNATLDLGALGPLTIWRNGRIQTATIIGPAGSIVIPENTTANINRSNIATPIVVPYDTLLSLANATLQSSMTIEDRGEVEIVGNLTFNGGMITLLDDNTYPTQPTKISVWGNFLYDPYELPNFQGAGEIVFDGPSDGGEFHVTSSYAILGADITIRTGSAGGLITAGPYDGVVNYGTIQSQTDGKTLVIDVGYLDNANLLSAVADGMLEIRTPDWSNDGNIHLNSGTIVITGDTFTNNASGVIDGTGTFDVSGTVFTNHGYIAPGLSPGVLNIIGDLLMGPTSKLVIEVGGTMPGVDYDQLVITGNVTLDGLLQIDFINDFVPQPGDQFQLLSASSLEGIFDDIITTGIDSDVHFSAQTGTLSFTIPEPSSLMAIMPGVLACLCRRSRQRMCA